MAKPYRLANQKLCYIQMSLNINKGLENDREQSKEWLVNTDPGFLTPVLTQLCFQSHRLLFSHASEEVRGKNMPNRKFASTGSRTHNHQVMSDTLTHQWANRAGQHAY